MFNKIKKWYWKGKTNRNDWVMIWMYFNLTYLYICMTRLDSTYAHDHAQIYDLRINNYCNFCFIFCDLIKSWNEMRSLSTMHLYLYNPSSSKHSYSSIEELCNNWFLVQFMQLENNENVENARFKSKINNIMNIYI